jgi:CBS domain-containing protein
MEVRDIMTPNPLCAEPSTPLQQVAQMMIDCDCGGIPVCESGTTRLVGFITDRDIVCRVLAQGANPLERTAQDAMTREVHTIQSTASVDDCICDVMERFRVRRAPVTDEQGNIVGIVSQADLVTRGLRRQPEIREELEEALEGISEARVAI